MNIRFADIVLDLHGASGQLQRAFTKAMDLGQADVAAAIRAAQQQVAATMVLLIKLGLSESNAGASELEVAES